MQFKGTKDIMFIEYTTLHNIKPYYLDLTLDRNITFILLIDLLS